ncbi:MAG TPA: cytochrome P450 [Polyangiales bacterium]|nr:cytochrome P450 [Polyangiales bacterium]
MVAAAASDAWFGWDPFQRSQELRDNPYPILSRIREEHPVHRTPLGDYRIFRHADVLRLLRDTKVGVRTTDGRLPGVDESRIPRRFMLMQDPPNHTRLRRLVSRGFTPPAIERLRPEVQALVERMLDAAQDAGDMDVIRDLAQPLPAAVICQMLGVPIADSVRLAEWTAQVTHMLMPRFMDEQQRQRSLDAAMQLAGYFGALVEERRQGLGDDLLSVLIRAEETGDRLTADELIVQAIGLLIAGLETTTGLIGNGVRTLLLHPTELRKLLDRPALIQPAVEECLRYDGPIGGTLRVVHEDVAFGGVCIPKNSLVTASISAAQRDPRAFVEPDRFLIERGAASHLAFGGGIHFCLGAHLARMEAQIAIGTLFRRFPRLQLESDQLHWSRSLFRIQSSLKVRF